MTREELRTAAQEAKAWRLDVAGEGDWPWLTEDELASEYGLPEPDAVFISLASPDTILELLDEVDEARKALDWLLVASGRPGMFLEQAQDNAKRVLAGEGTAATVREGADKLGGIANLVKGEGRD